jgi:hypothetical protein
VAARISQQNKAFVALLRLAYLLAAGRLPCPLGKYKTVEDVQFCPRRSSAFRDIGFAQTDDEAREEENRAVMHRPRPKRLYPSLWV